MRWKDREVIFCDRCYGQNPGCETIQSRDMNGICGDRLEGGAAGTSEVAGDLMRRRPLPPFDRFGKVDESNSRLLFGRKADSCRSR
jgi:hypothetical protein